MDKLTNVIVGVDFSNCSAAALAQGVRIAGWNRSRIRVVHIAEPLIDVMPDPVFLPGPMLDVGGDPVQNARDQWERFAKATPAAAGLKLEVLVGNPLVEMTHAVRESHTELVVIGSHGAVARAKGVGLFAAGCVRRAGAKVLLVREQATGPFKCVVACVDFSPASLEAVAAAARIATQDSATFYVLHVYRAPWDRIHAKAPDPLASPDFHARYQEAMCKHIEEFLRPLEHEMKYIKPKCQAVNDEGGGHGHGIAAFASACGADLAVLGTRGKTNLRDLVLGSTAERVLRDIPCSVLAVPPTGA